MTEKLKKIHKNYIQLMLCVILILAGLIFIHIYKDKQHHEKKEIVNPVTCTIEIRCDSVLDNRKLLSNPGLKKYIPDDGVILPPTMVVVEKGQSVYDVLKKITYEKEIQMESQLSTAFQSQYVQGLNHLYEKNFGQYSGWLYYINDKMPDYGCSEQIVEENDKILWEYTCGE